MKTLTREELIAENAWLKEKLAQMEVQLNWLKEQFKLAQHRQFGTSSERTTSGESQTELLFNEAENVADSAPEDAIEETVTYTRKQKSVGHRQEMIKDLPVEVREYRRPQEEQVCSCCGGHLHEMSTQTRDELVIIPASAKVIRHLQYSYSCRNCEKNEINVPIVTASAPAPLIPKSLASPSSVAYVMGMKYVEGMPLYRQEKHFERLGIELPRSILSNWVLKGGEMLEVIYNRMHDVLVDLSVLHADETTVQVLREAGKSPQSKSYMWLYRSGRDGPPIVLYEYQPTRDGEHPKRFLDGFAGYMHVDGYQGYNDVKKAKLSGCWSHARRKFTDARGVLPKDKQSEPENLSNIALKYINKLFDIERDLAKVSPEERKAARYDRSKPLLEEFKEWLDKNVSQVLPKSALGEAFTYCQNQWPKLLVFLEDGRLEISNNRAERSIRPFVIGRKNWLFSNTPRGARTSAIIYSIVETAKENGLNPFAYLQYLLEQLPGTDTTDKEVVDLLLPWSETVKSALQSPPSLPVAGTTSS